MKQKAIVVLGSDGYIGYPLTQILLKTYKDFKIIGIDNCIKRILANDEMESKSITPILPIYERTNILKQLGDYDFYNLDLCDTDNDVSICNILSKYEIHTIINLAHQPSGPFSQKSMQHANFTLMNNIIGTNNLLYYMKDNCPNAHLITLGTMGEYSHDIGVDIEEGYFEITKVDGQRSKESIFPRRPGSIYHTSKTASTYLIDLLVRSWGLKVTDIMQGVVVGLYVNDTPDVSSFWIDEAFGTVVNRFCAQATINEPVTVFGSGNHSRTFLTLQDSIQALLIAIDNPPTDTSKPRVWNQLSEHWKIIDLANYINEKTNCGINHINSPRTENTEEHYYNVKTDILNSLGYKPSRTIKEEIDFLLSLLPRFKDNIESQKSLILPNIKW